MKIDELERRPADYVRDTGVPFLGVGLFWGIYGVVQLIAPVIGRTNRNLSLTVGAVGMTCALLAMVGVLILQQRIMERWAGSAVPARTSRRAIAVPLGVMAGVALALIVAWVVTDRRTILSSGASFFAAVVGLSVAALAWEKRSRVGFYFSGYLVALGVVLWWTRLDFFRGMAWLAIAAGWPMAIYGAVLLRRFLRANPE